MTTATPLPVSIALKSRLAALAAEWPHELLPEIRQQVADSGRKIVVLDDDPTGTQTVHNIPVLTHWSEDALATELSGSAPALYLLTNSRSLTEPAAVRLNREIGRNLAAAARRSGVPIEVISRSDSTLRGHFPAEVTALAETIGYRQLPCLLVPFFHEGGRYTIDDVHYVAEGERLIPAADTAYARDAVFGYQHSDLRQWVAEKTRGVIPAEAVATIAINTLRQEGPSAVADQLCVLPPGSMCAVNAASYRDLEVLVAGLLMAEAAGRRFIFRTAASFVRVRAGIAPRPLLSAAELTTPAATGGLFVVGSYVPKTTAQLNKLTAQTGIETVAIEVAELLSPTQAAKTIAIASHAINTHIAAGRDVVLYTSRRLITATDDAGNLDIGARVSDALIQVVRGLEQPPRYLVAKGGITSSDVATRGLTVRRAMVLGQVLPGIPVWRLGQESRYPGMAYMVFPGNVGSDDALAEIYHRLAK
ncbi:MAG: four-carbon acid sugar kinase family protein [Desulfosarcinaceae bacterium]|nr:four-carbon acid sugar kinase family protein [Desulfosarcinaceae bacterium]